MSNTTMPDTWNKIKGSEATNESMHFWGNFADSDAILVLYGIICTLGITGNLLVAFVLLRVPSLRTNTSYFLVHLSVVDFIVCVLVIPFKLMPTAGMENPNPGFFGELRCRLFVSQYLFWVCAVTSVYGLVTVNLERYVAIVYHYRYRLLFTKRNKYLMIASCWMIGVFVQSHNVFLYGEDESAMCKFWDWPNKGVKVVVGCINFLIPFLLPFIFMIVVQWQGISTLKRQIELLHNKMASSANNRATRREMWKLQITKTLSKTLLVFALTFAVCWAPNKLFVVLYYFGVHEDFSNPIYHVTVILGIGNSCVNPITYILTNRPFRRGIRKAFRGEKESTGDEATGSTQHQL